MAQRNKASNKNFVADEYKEFSSWEEAVKAAERLLLRIQVREREVKAALRLFKERVKEGETWPGSTTKV
jgi:hypothetical protein